MEKTIEWSLDTSKFIETIQNIKAKKSITGGKKLMKVMDLLAHYLIIF